MSPISRLLLPNNLNWAEQHCLKGSPLTKFFVFFSLHCLLRKEKSKQAAKHEHQQSTPLPFVVK